VVGQGDFDALGVVCNTLFDRQTGTGLPQPSASCSILLVIKQIGITTRARTEFQDITGKVQEIVDGTDITSGVCFVYVPHTTAAVMINEHADPDVVEDIGAQLEKLVPSNQKYQHMEGNSAAHIKASIIGGSKAIPIEHGRLALGIWQGIFFCEFDGPRNRSLMVKIIGDK
jgi:secondary thiamine-phosphate synthase enzyme